MKKSVLAYFSPRAVKCTSCTRGTSISALAWLQFSFNVFSDEVLSSTIADAFLSVEGWGARRTSPAASISFESSSIRQRRESVRGNRVTSQHSFRTLTLVPAARILERNHGFRSTGSPLPNSALRATVALRACARWSEALRSVLQSQPRSEWHHALSHALQALPQRSMWGHEGPDMEASLLHCHMWREALGSFSSSPSLVIQSLITDGNWQKAMEVYLMCQKVSATVKPITQADPRTHLPEIESINNLQKKDLADAVLRDVILHQRLLLATAGQCWTSALGLLRTSMFRGHSFPTEIHQIVASTFGKQRQWAAAAVCFQLVAPELGLEGSRDSCLDYADRQNQSRQLLSKLQSPSHQSRDVIRQILHLNPCPDGDMRDRLVAECYRTADWATAIDVCRSVGDYRSQQLAVSAAGVLFNAEVEAKLKEDPAAAWRFALELGRRHMEERLVTTSHFGLMMRCCVSADAWRQALTLLRTARATNNPVRSSTAAKVSKLLSVRGLWREAVKVAQDEEHIDCYRSVLVAMAKSSAVHASSRVARKSYMNLRSDLHDDFLLLLKALRRDKDQRLRVTAMRCARGYKLLPDEILHAENKKDRKVWEASIEAMVSKSMGRIGDGFNGAEATSIMRHAFVSDGIVALNAALNRLQAAFPKRRSVLARSATVVRMSDANQH